MEKRKPQSGKYQFLQGGGQPLPNWKGQKLLLKTWNPKHYQKGKKNAAQGGKKKKLMMLS